MASAGRTSSTPDPAGAFHATRRRLLRSALWIALGGGAAAGSLTIGRYLWPGERPTGPHVHVSFDRVPQPGADPVLIEDLRERGFWLINLRPGEGLTSPLPAYRGSSQAPPFDAAAAADGGILAFVNRGTEPVQNCRLEWRAEVRFLGLASVFYNPCSSSVFTRAGYRVFGPAPRPLDTLAMYVQPDGSIVVDTTDVRKGGLENALRAVRR